MNIPILFEDGEALVIDKPAGLPLETPRRGGPALSDHFEALKLGFHRPPAIVHRLDTDTSGCLLLARNPKALKRFNRAFEDRQVTKRYLGIVAGEVAEEEGTITLALSKVSSEKQGWRMIPARAGKPSVTHWRRIAVMNGNSLLEFRPETGRTHQIRVHAASGLNAPLLGDPLYGQRLPYARMMLHAADLTIPRETKDDIAARAPPPPEFAELGFAGFTDG